LDIDVLLFTYLTIYNFSLILFFAVIFGFINSNIHSLNKFTHLSFNFYSVFVITILLMSMAGVPPFVGFFSKLFIIILLATNSFFLFYSLLFIFFFAGLYFYIQNIRRLHSTNGKLTSFGYLFYEICTALFSYCCIWFLILTSLGFLTIDDISFVWVWNINS